MNEPDVWAGFVDGVVFWCALIGMVLYLVGAVVALYWLFLPFLGMDPL